MDYRNGIGPRNGIGLMYPVDRPLRPQWIEIRYQEFVRAVPTEGSHTWWQVIDDGPDKGKALHRSAFRQIKSSL